MNTYFSLPYIHSSLTAKFGKTEKLKFGRIDSCSCPERLWVVNFTKNVRAAFAQTFNVTYVVHCEDVVVLGNNMLPEKFKYKANQSWEYKNILQNPKYGKTVGEIDTIQQCLLFVLKSALSNCRVFKVKIIL